MPNETDKQELSEETLKQWYSEDNVFWAHNTRLQPVINALRAARQELANVSVEWVRCRGRIAELEQELVKAEQFKIEILASKNQCISKWMTKAAELEQQLAAFKPTLKQANDNNLTLLDNVSSLEQKLASASRTVEQEQAIAVQAQQQSQRDQERIGELEKVLKLLDSVGGLGLDKHEWIRTALAKKGEKDA